MYERVVRKFWDDGWVEEREGYKLSYIFILFNDLFFDIELSRLSWLISNYFLLYLFILPTSYRSIIIFCLLPLIIKFTTISFCLLFLFIYLLAFCFDLSNSKIFYLDLFEARFIDFVKGWVEDFGDAKQLEIEMELFRLVS